MRNECTDKKGSIEDVGVAAARKIYLQMDYEILGTNRMPVSGSIDLIARKGDLVVFAELAILSEGSARKARTTCITKHLELIEASFNYLAGLDFDGDPQVRFDIVGLLKADDDSLLISLHQNSIYIGDEASGANLKGGCRDLCSE